LIIQQLSGILAIDSGTANSLSIPSLSTLRVGLNNFEQIFLFHGRPWFFQEKELSVRQLPKQKIAEP